MISSTIPFKHGYNSNPSIPGDNHISKIQKMKKIFILLAFALWQTMAYGTVSVTIGSDPAATPGPGLDIPVNVDFSIGNVGNYTFNIQYDNTVLSAPVLANVTSGFTSTEINVTAVSGNLSTVTIFWMNEGSGTNHNGKLFDLRFNYFGGNSNLTMTSATVGDVAGNPIYIIPIVNGSVTQVVVTPGITVGTVETLPFVNLQVPVYANTLYNIGAFSFELEFDPANAGIDLIDGTVLLTGVYSPLNTKGTVTYFYNSATNIISIAWSKGLTVSENVSFPDNQILFYLSFDYRAGDADLDILSDPTPLILYSDATVVPGATFTDGAITQLKRDADVTWPISTSITYGDALSESTLSGGSAIWSLSNVPGSFAFTAPSTIPNANPAYQANVTFTPSSDEISGQEPITYAMLYQVETQDVSVQVDKATQTISWSNPADITYGTLLSGTQLDATVSVPVANPDQVAGALSYNPTAGTELDAGTHTLTVTAAATSNYNEATETVSLTVNKGTQTITWNAPEYICAGVALSATQLNATAVGTGSSAVATPVYNVALGVVLPQGEAPTLWVTFPETLNYIEAVETFTIIVRSTFTVDISANQTICYNTTPAELTSSVYGASGVYNSYVWEYSTNGTDWNTVNDVHGGTYTPNALTTTTHYRLTVNDTEGCGPVTSDPITVTVRDNFDGGTLSAASQTICYNTTPADITYGTDPSGGSSLQYQWHKKEGNITAPSGYYNVSIAVIVGGWDPIGLPGNSTTLPGSVIDDLTTTTTFALRVVDTGDPMCMDTWAGNAHVVNVYDNFTAGAIATIGETICYAGTPIEIGSTTAASGGDEDIDYTWRSSADSYASDISGATSATYTPPSGLTATTTYRRYVNDGTCNTTPTQSIGEWTVTVYEELVLTAPANITSFNDPGACTAEESFAATVNGEPTPITVVYSVDGTPITSPYNFPVGTTTVDIEASNSCKTVNGSFTVTVVDNEDPTISCATPAANYNPDNGLCTYTVPGTDLDPTVTVDNCGILSVINSYNSTSTLEGASFPAGTTPVTWTITDIHGNDATCSYDIVVIDNEDPTITCATPAASYNADNGECFYTVPNTDLDPTASADNCSIQSVVNDHNSSASLAGATFNVGSTTVVWTITDVYGNDATCTYDVVVVDNQNPTITCATPASSYEADNGVCTYTVPGTALDPIATADNCSIQSVVNDYNSSATLEGATFDVGTTTVVWTITDVNSNTTTCSYDVVVEDTQDPTITCATPASSYEADNGVCTYTVPGTDLDPTATADNCSIQSVVNDYNSSATLEGATFNVGTTTVTWTITDIHSNSTTCTYDVEVVDNELPTITCPTDVVVSNDLGLCTASGVALGTPITLDNCGVDNVINDAPTVYNLGSNTVTWTVSDIHSNEASCNQTVTVNDTQDPEFHNFPADIPSLTAGSSCQYYLLWTPPTASDNCTGTVTVTASYTDYTPGPGVNPLSPYSALYLSGAMHSGFFEIGTHEITYTATDANGNQTSQAFTFTIVDLTPPFYMMSCPAPVVVNNDLGSCGAVVTPGVHFIPPMFGESCSNPITTGNTLFAGNYYPVGVNTVTYWGEDAAGNRRTCTFTITVIDDEDPIAQAQDLTIYLDNNGEASITASEVNDGSSDVCTDAGDLQLTLNTSDFDCNNVGPNTVTLTVTDEGENFSTATATITVIDDINPDLSLPVPANPYSMDNGSCFTSLSLPATATDNCSIEHIKYYIGSPASEITFPYEFPLGTTVVTAVATDVNGNTDTDTYSVVVEDTEIPVIASVATIYQDADNGECSAVVTISTPTASDNCTVDGLVVGSRSDSELLSDPYPVGTTTITWTVSDVNGNAATPVTQDVVISDTQIPVIASVSNITQTADAGLCSAGISITAPGTTDNCGIQGSVLGTRSDSELLSAPYPVGTTTITWTVSDIHGNHADAVVQTITVSDDEIPVISLLGDATVEVWQYNSYTDAGATAADNCEVDLTASIVTDNPVNTSVPGVYTVTYNVSDAASNNALEVTRTVTVLARPVIAFEYNETGGTSHTYCYGTNLTIDLASVTAGAAPFSVEFEIFDGATTTPYTVSVSNVNDILYGPSLLDPATYTITYTGITDANGVEATAALLSSMTTTVTINPLPDAPVAGNLTETYTGAVFTASADVNTGESVVWYDAETNGNVYVAPSATNAGTYTAWAEAVIDATGCISTARTLVILTINQVALTLTAEDKAKIYGEADPTLTAIYSGFVNSENETVITGTYSLSRALGEDIGPYTISVDASGLSANNYAISTETGTLTITAKELYITGAVAQNKVYDGTDAASVDFSGASLVGVVGGTDVSLNYSGYIATFASSVVATHDVTIQGLVLDGLQNANYTLAPLTGLSAAITQKSLTITADNQSKEYGELFTFLGNEYEVVGLVGGDVVSTVEITSTGAPATAAAISHDILIGNASGTGLSNYTITYVPGTFTVTPKALQITANNDTKVYGSLYTFDGTEFTSTGLVNSDEVTWVSLSSLGTPVTAIVDDYDIIASAATGTGLSNYTISYVLGNLSVTAKDLTITAADQSKTYGESFSFTGTEFTSSGLVNSDAISSVTLISNATPVTAAVGNYPIEASAALGTGLGNYTISYVDGDFTVVERTLTITANSDSKTYGDLFSFNGTEFTTSGLANGDGIASASISSAGAPVSAVVFLSPYDIEISNAVAELGTVLSNYDISYVFGTLSVGRKDLNFETQAQTKTYGDEVVFNHTEYSVSGLVTANGDEVTGVTISSNGAPATAGVAGSPYPINLSDVLGSGIDNYTIVVNAASLTVNPKALTVDVKDDLSKTFGDAYVFSVNDLVITGLVNGDQVTGATFVSAGEVNTANVAGSPYTVTASAAVGTGIDNYAITYEAGLLAVTKRPMAMRLDNKTKVYGNIDPSYTTDWDGLASFDSPSVVSGFFLIYRETGENVGTYQIQIFGEPVADNYTITVVNGVLTITPKAITITANNIEKPYGTNYIFAGAEFTVSPLYPGETIASASFASSGAAPYVHATTYDIQISDAVAGPGTLLTNYTITYTNGTMTVLPSVDQTDLSGHVAYFVDGASDWDLSGVEVRIYDASDVLIDQVSSGTDGVYSFIQVLPSSIANIEFKVPSGIAWGGANATDALGVQLNAINTPPAYWTPEQLINHVGDVNADGKTATLDAMFINYRFLYPTAGFDAGDWAFFADNSILANTDASSARISDPVNENGVLYLPSVSVRAYGDVDASFTLGSGKSWMNAQTGDLMQVELNEAFELPIYFHEAIALGAASLEMEYQANILELVEVYCDLTGFEYSLENGILRATWSSIDANYFQAGDAIAVLRMIAKKPIAKEDILILWSNSTELADPNALRIAGLLPVINKITTDNHVEITPEDIRFEAYPSPFTEVLQVSYSIPSDAQIQLSLLDVQGRVVAELGNRFYESGNYQWSINPQEYKLTPGVYQVRLKVDSAKASGVQYIKVVYSRQRIKPATPRV